MTWFFVSDFPDRNRFLTPAETAYVLSRIEEDRGDALPDTMSWAKVRQHLMDWKIWVYGAYLSLSAATLRIDPSLPSGFMYIAATMPAYSVGFFMPIILHDGMGWSISKTLLLVSCQEFGRRSRTNSSP